MKHIHAELMALYAQDAAETDRPWDRWEYKHPSDAFWYDSITNPEWRADCQYRRKPKMLSINGFEFPEPCRVAPTKGTPYCVPKFAVCGGSSSFDWAGDAIDKQFLAMGFVHLTEEAATRHADAILSATK